MKNQKYWYVKIGKKLVCTKGVSFGVDEEDENFFEFYNENRELVFYYRKDTNLSYLIKK